MPPPAPVKLGLADLARDARTPAQWFQIVHVDIAAPELLDVYDLSPAELALRGTCQAWSGFAMIPHSLGAPRKFGEPSSVMRW